MFRLPVTHHYDLRVLGSLCFDTSDAAESAKGFKMGTRLGAQRNREWTASPRVRASASECGRVRASAGECNAGSRIEEYVARHVAARGVHSVGAAWRYIALHRSRVRWWCQSNDDDDDS